MMQSSFAETLDILFEALERLNGESEPLGLRVSWVKTKIQAINDILDAAILSVYLFVGRMSRSQTDSLTLAVIFMSAGCEPVVIDIWVKCGKSWIHWIMGFGVVDSCAGGRKSESSGPWCFQSFSVDVRLGL